VAGIGCLIEVSERLKFSVKPHGTEALPNCCGNLGFNPKLKVRTALKLGLEFMIEQTKGILDLKEM
jgi:hypothetical protein